MKQLSEQKTKSYRNLKAQVLGFFCACSTILIPEPSPYLMNYSYDTLGFSEHLLMYIKIHLQGGGCSFIHIVFARDLNDL